MKILQLLNVDGEQAGLYTTKRTDDKIQEDFDTAFGSAKAREEHYYENDYEEEINVQEEADIYLEKKDIFRTFSENVTTEII